LLSNFVNKVIYGQKKGILFSFFAQKENERGKKPYLFLFVEAVLAPKTSPKSKKRFDDCHFCDIIK